MDAQAPTAAAVSLADLTCARILEDPHHVLVPCEDGDTVEILNKVFEIPPADATRVESLPTVGSLQPEGA